MLKIIVLTAVTLALSACIVVPVGPGHDNGHRDSGHRDSGDRHDDRHDRRRHRDQDHRD